MNLSKTKIDKAGQILSKNEWKLDEDFIHADDVFNEYRMSHLEPLTEVTIKLQEWLDKFSHEYYVAQRLKRRPQILRKLLRFSVRLSQLQDIGGCRIIVENNEVVDGLVKYIRGKLTRSRYFEIKRIADYREKGRDVTGYRAVHIIVERNNRTLEIQIRSRIQHYWAESIERTSIIYKHHLKEMEGHPTVLQYFKVTSDAFFEIEAGRKPTAEHSAEIDSLRRDAEQIIKVSDTYNVLNSSVEEGFIRAMIEKDMGLRGRFHNWMLIFNWNTGKFEYWLHIDRDPLEASAKYAQYEKQWPAEQGYEVVMIGASDVSTIRHTHSHYFGIESYDKILESIDESVLAFQKRNVLDSDSRAVLNCLSTKGYWGTKKVSIDTVRNHYCKDVESIEDTIRELSKEGYVVVDFRKGYVSLNIKKKAIIEAFL